MSRLEFTKMHGAGNDFVVLDGVRATLPEGLAELAVRLCDRRFGVGADTVLVVRPSANADFRMDIFNADGSVPEMCANGIRCFYQYVRDRGLTAADEIGVETLGGVVRPRAAGPDQVRVDMGRPVLDPAKVPTALRQGDGPVLEAPLEVAGRTLRVASLSMGNPHCVVPVDDPETTPVETLGPLIEHHRSFPNRVNVEFVAPAGRGRLRQRTWERGVGETLACGSGACAAAVASMLRGVVDAEVVVELRGGELVIEWDPGRPESHVFMTGPTVEVFTGSFALQEG